MKPAVSIDPTYGINPRITVAIIEIIISIIISPSLLPRTWKALEIERDIPASSITIITNINITTGIRIIVIAKTAPTIDAIIKVKNRLKT